MGGGRGGNDGVPLLWRAVVAPLWRGFRGVGPGVGVGVELELAGAEEWKK